MKKTKKLKFSLLILPIFIFLAFTLSDSDDFQLIKNIEIFQAVLKNLRTDYVYKINITKLVNTAINSMLRTLDPYTNYYPENKLETIRLISEARYTGIGIVVKKINGNFFIDQVLKNSPADKAGLKVGDQILKVQNINAHGLSYEQLHNLITGEPNTLVSIEIKKLVNDSTFKLKIKRENIKISPIEKYAIINNKYGYIHISQFSDNTYQNFSKIFGLMYSKGIKGLIIDLRDNPGGLLDQAVGVLSTMLPKNTLVVTVKGKNPKYNAKYYTPFNPISTSIPVTVLVNNNSASASEIVSGALQDLDRAVIIGQQTFGKGLVQRTTKLPYNSMLKITIAQYYIPSGRCIQNYNYRTHTSTKNIPDSLLKKFYTAHGRIVYEGKGIEPDLKVKLDSVSPFVQKLISSDLAKFYASVLIQKNPNLDVTNFSFSVSEFLKFLQKFNFTYSAPPLKLYKEFLKSLNKYDPALSDKFKPNIQLLNHSLRFYLIHNYSAVNKLIKLNILNLQNKNAQYLKFSKDFYDNQLNKAIYVLNNINFYNKILHK